MYLETQKALFISSREMYPVIGGDRIRTAQQLEFLSQMYDVDVVCISDKPDYELGELKGLIRQYHHFYMPKWKSYLSTLKGTLGSLPLQVNYYLNKKVARFVRQHYEDYDAIFCNNVRTAEFVMGLPRKEGTKLFIDFVDAISMNYDRAKEKSHWPKSWIYSIDAQRLNRYEKEVLRHFDRAMAISPADAAYIQMGANTDKQIAVVNNAVATNYGVDYSTYPGHVITFVGKMDYEPNIVAVENFACNVLPMIREEVTDATFQIVGIHPDSRVSVLSQLPGVFVVGYVEDVNRSMLESSFVVAPMLTGAGVQNKILQAMSLGCCVLTTPIGQEGIYTSEKVLEIANDNEALARISIELLQDPDRCLEVGKRAQKFVRGALSKEVVMEDFRKALEGKQVEN